MGGHYCTVARSLALCTYERGHMMYYTKSRCLRPLSVPLWPRSCCTFVHKFGPKGSHCPQCARWRRCFICVSEATEYSWGCSESHLVAPVVHRKQAAQLKNVSVWAPLLCRFRLRIRSSRPVHMPEAEQNSPAACYALARTFPGDGK